MNLRVDFRNQDKIRSGYNKGTEWCPRGLRSAIGNRVLGQSRVVGSNPTYSAMFMLPEANSSEIAQRDGILARVYESIRQNVSIRLPEFVGSTDSAPSAFALLSIIDQTNDFGGKVGEFGYQFEGEEDLLHLFVVRLDREKISVEEAQQVVSWLLPQLPPALVWLKPGEYSQHFYFGHDVLFDDETAI